MILSLFLLLLAPAARAVNGEEVTGLPLRDSLKRSEFMLSNGKRWLPIKGNTGLTGQDTAAGWGPLNPFPNVDGAYWSPNTFSDASLGDGAMLTVGTEPGIEGRYVSLWLNMPDPANARSGYELRWTQTKPPSTYTVALYKWVAGTPTALAMKEFVSIYSGTRMGISDSGSLVQAWWKGNEEVAHSLLSANDTTFSSGYAGVEGAGNLSRSYNFQAGALIGGVFSTAPSLDTLERQEVPLATGNGRRPGGPQRSEALGAARSITALEQALELRSQGPTGIPLPSRMPTAVTSSLETLAPGSKSPGNTWHCG